VINKAHDKWNANVREEVASILGRSFDRFAPNRMFSLANSPEWVSFLNDEFSSGVKAKQAAREFVAKFF
jgi:hypothetical protein